MITIQTTTFGGKPVAKPFSWSFSAIKNYETCPYRYQQIDLLKNVKEPESQELKDGFAVHAAMSKRIDHAQPLPPSMARYEKWVDKVMEGVDRTKMVFGTERKLAITAAMQPCDYFDKIKPVWLRTVADVLRVEGDYAHIVDWKTGKVKPEPDQLLLIATCVMVHYPQVRRFHSQLVWMVYDEVTTMTFNHTDLEDFWTKTELDDDGNVVKASMVDRVEALRRARETNDFPPKQSGLCRRWCPVTKCEYCGRE